MKKNALVIILAAASVVVSVIVGMALMTRQNESISSAPQRRTVTPQPQTSSTAIPETARVPAYFKTAPGAGVLPQTLPPENFTGQTRDAYKAVKEIPQIIAQLPCYCYCDEEHGHKSLHSCFETDHAAGCGVCVQEALAA